MASKFALIIANTEYNDPGLAQLTAPGKDAKTFGQVLDSPDYGAFHDVIILLNENESKVSESIDYFFSLKKPDDLLLLYFSGHGIRDEYGSLYLAVKNTNRARLRSTAIKADFIREAMDQSRSKRQVIILDCCNSGAFAQGTKAEAGGSMGTASAFQGTGVGRVVLTASDATQFAWEGDKIIGETENSLFTHFLVSGIKGEADLDGDGSITVDELYDYVYEQILDLTPQQTPGKWSYKQHGEIVLRDNVKPREVKPAPLPTDMLELLSHANASVRRAGIQDLVNLLEGKHLGLARAAEDKLREIAGSDESLSLRKVASDALSTHGLAADQSEIAETSKPKLSEIRPVALTDRSAKLENAGTQQTAGPLSVSESKEIARGQRAVTSARPKTLWLLMAGLVGFIGLLCGGILIWGAMQSGGADADATASQSAQEKIIQAALTQTAAAQPPVSTVSSIPTILNSPTIVPPTLTFTVTEALPSPEGMAPSGKIVFTCFIDQIDQICLMNADGTGRRQLTDFSVTAFYPSLSHDGQTIYFSSKQSSGFEIYSMDINGRNLMRLTNNIGSLYAPELSPNGEQIAFANNGIWVMKPDGRNPRPLTNRDDVDPTWSPDGSMIAFASSRTGERQLYIMETDGSNIRQVTDLDNMGGRMAWSPDGMKLAFYRGPDNGRDIYVINIDGTELTRLTNGGDNIAPSWSPDGNWIAFASYRDGNLEIYIMHPDGTGVMRLTNNSISDWQPRWGQ